MTFFPPELLVDLFRAQYQIGPCGDCGEEFPLKEHRCPSTIKSDEIADENDRSEESTSRGAWPA